MNTRHVNSVVEAHKGTVRNEFDMTINDGQEFMQMLADGVPSLEVLHKAFLYGHRCGFEQVLAEDPSIGNGDISEQSITKAYAKGRLDGENAERMNMPFILCDEGENELARFKVGEMAAEYVWSHKGHGYHIDRMAEDVPW